MAKENSQLNWGWVWLTALVILVLVFMAVRSLTRERLDVRVAQVTRQSLKVTESTNGRVEPEMNIQVTSPISTTVKAVYVQPGDTVTAGKVLMQLDDIDALAKLATAESGVKTAQAMLDAATHNGTLEQQQASAAEVTRDRMDRDQAQHDLDALTKLNAAGAASGSEVAAAQRRLEAAQAALAAAETSGKNRYSPAELARAQAALSDAEANLAAARDVENRTSVRAPVSGTVYMINARPTDFVEAGKLLLQMADLKQEQVRAYYDEPDIGGLRVGEPALITWDAIPGKTWNGQVERVPVTVEQYGVRRVGEALISVSDSNGQLLPDTNVTVTVTTSSQENALVIPKEALVVQNARAFVFRVEGDQLKRTPVTYGTLNVNQAEILSGLKEGEWVATGTISGQPLQEGMPIKEVK